MPIKQLSEIMASEESVEKAIKRYYEYPVIQKELSESKEEPDTFIGKGNLLGSTEFSDNDDTAICAHCGSRVKKENLKR